MKSKILKTFAVALFLVTSFSAHAQFDWDRLLKAGEQALQSALITDEQMIAYVQQSVYQLDSVNTVLPATNAYSKRLAKLTKGLTHADGIPLNFKVYETKEVNAFACPDGSVRVYTGIMDLLNDEELLGVIGHEIGHVLMRHSRKAMQNQMMTGAFKEAIAASHEKVAKLTESQLGALSETFVNSKYSRKQETEADECGYKFLVAMGCNPWGMVSAFEKMDALDGSGLQDNAIAKMFSSHPDMEKRIKNISKKCKKDGYTRP